MSNIAADIYAETDNIDSIRMRIWLEMRGHGKSGFWAWTENYTNALEREINEK